jgi:hypothetical protein
MRRKKQKSYFHAALAATVAVSAAIVAPTGFAEAASFPDVKSTDYFYEAVTSLTERGIIKGFPDGTFKPYQSVTRGQAAKILAGVLGLDTNNVKNPGFTDVSTSNEYYGAIAALANAGIINGYPDGTFKPNAPIHRNHMAKILALAFGLKASPTATTPFTDLNHQEYEGYIKALYENKITTGMTPTTFGGTSNVTRGQFATFVFRAEKGTKPTTDTTDTTEVTFTISDINGNHIIAGSQQYKVAGGIQGLLDASNKPALQGAVVKAEVQNGEIVSIRSLELNKSGKSGELITLDGKNTNIAGNVTINADYVAVKNLNVEGKLLLSKQVASVFSASHVTVKDELYVADKQDTQNAPTLTIHLTDVSPSKLTLERKRSVITSDKAISELVLTDAVYSVEINGIVELLRVHDNKEISGEGIILKAVVSKAADLSLNFTGKIGELRIEQKEANVKLGSDMEIKKLAIPAGASLEKIIRNFAEIRYSIKIGELMDLQGQPVSFPAYEIFPVVRRNGVEQPFTVVSNKDVQVAEYKNILAYPGDRVQLTPREGTKIHYQVESYPRPNISCPPEGCEKHVPDPLTYPVYTGPIEIKTDSTLIAAVVKDGAIIGEFTVNIFVGWDDAISWGQFPILKVNGKEKIINVSTQKKNGYEVGDYGDVSALSKAEVEFIPREGTAIYYWLGQSEYYDNDYDYASARKYTGPIEVRKATHLSGIVMRGHKVVGEFSVNLWIFDR